MNYANGAADLRLLCVSAVSAIAAFSALLAPVLPSQNPTPAARPFTVSNIASRAGLDFRQNNFATETKYPFETMGGAVAALDFNADGWLDLFFLNGAPSPSHTREDPASFNRLYRNNGPGLTFTDVTESSGLSGKGTRGYPQGVAVGDYDNDGFPDIYVTNFGDNVLYRNNGDGTFSDVTARAGVAMSGHPFKASACWLDADNDGHLDLFVTHYFQWTFEEHGDYYCGARKPGYRTYCRPDEFDPLPNVLYRNNGDGTFSDVSERSGIRASRGKGMGVAIADYDNDGWIDIFVANDRAPNFLFHNKGKGVFEEVALEAGVWANESGAWVSGMGCDFNDFNNDGLPDIFYTDLITECFTLFVNRGNGLFHDATFPSGIGQFSASRSGWSNRFMDWDNDGWKDLLIAGSHVLDNCELYNSSSRYKEPCYFLLNRRNGTFQDISGQLGPDFQTAGAFRGLAVGDFDNDGSLEAAFSRLNDSCVFFKRDRPPEGHWLLLDLHGRKSPRDGIGTRVRAVLPSGSQVYDHATTGYGIYSAGDRRIHLGLGDAASVQLLELKWPSGIVQKLENVRANQVLKIEEPQQ